MSVAEREAPGDAFYVFVDPYTQTHVHVERRNRILRFRVKRPGTVETFTLQSTGRDVLDRVISFLILLITSGTGNFKFNMLRRSSLVQIKEQLRQARPDLVSDDPADTLITLAFTLHFPSSYILPAGREYVETVARAVRAAEEDERLASTIVSRLEMGPTDVYRILGAVTRTVQAGMRRLGFDVGDYGNILSRLAFSLLRKHYSNVLPGELPFRVEQALGRFNDIFINEFLLFLISHPARLNQQLRLLVHRSLPQLVSTVEIEKTDGSTYRARIVFSRPGRPRLEFTLNYDSGRLLSVFVPFPFEKTGETIMKRLFLASTFDEHVSLLDRNSNALLIAEPGRAILVDLDREDYQVFTSFRELREALARYQPTHDFPPALLKTLGPGFYGSEELERAVLATGCLTCTDYDVLNRNITLARLPDGNWKLAVLHETKRLERHQYVEESPEKVILRTLPTLLSTMSDEELRNVEKYVPGISKLRPVGEKLVEWTGKGRLVFGYFDILYPFVGVSLAVNVSLTSYSSSFLEGVPGTIISIARIYVFTSELPEEKRLKIVRRPSHWRELAELKPGFEEILSSLGFEQVPRARRKIIFKTGNVYVAVKRKS